MPRCALKPSQRQVKLSNLGAIARHLTPLTRLNPNYLGARVAFVDDRDVSRAADLAPGDNLIRAFLAKLRAEKARQKEADRATFAGMFDRGTVCDPE